jgi:hypothetical protein
MYENHRSDLVALKAQNDRYGVAYLTYYFGLAEYLGGSMGEAEAYFAESFGVARRARMRASTAYALLGLAMVARASADVRRSARLHGAAGHALAELGETIEPLDGRLRDLDCQRLRSAMGTEAFESEYAAGQALTPAQIADLVADRWVGATGQ